MSQRVSLYVKKGVGYKPGKAFFFLASCSLLAGCDLLKATDPKNEDFERLLFGLSIPNAHLLLMLAGFATGAFVVMQMYCPIRVPVKFQRAVLHLLIAAFFFPPQWLALT